MCRKTELLAPAGSLEILEAAIEAGADAVYAAGGKFGARAYAKNFTEEEMLTAIDYVHIRGKRLYLTVNTLLKEQEIEELYEYLCPLYEAGLDAVIVQDIGVMHYIRNHFPDLSIHASTQMTVTGAYGAKLLMEHGCSRIVTARELSLAEISHIYRTTGAEIESFVHGALCYCYSGQCLMSSMIGGRSGNRGRCAQPCRLPYELQKTRQGSVCRQEGKYLLSLKDLCTIEMIPELVQSGIHSFKIEGRMKQEAYVAGVTAVYRKYLDLYENHPNGDYQVSNEDYQKLLNLGNRSGFTDGYYQRQNGRQMVTFQKPSHEKNSGETQTGIDNNRDIQVNKEKINGILRIFINNPASLMLEYKGIQAEVSGFTVQTAEKQPLEREAVLARMKKTGNTPFTFEQLQIEMDAGSFVPAGALNQLRRDGIEKLTALVLAKHQRRAPIRRKDSRTIWYKQEEQRQEALMRLSVLTETVEQFQVVLAQPEAERIYLEAVAFSRAQLCREVKELAGQAHAKGKTCYLALPHVFRRQTADWYAKNWRQIAGTGVDGYLVRNLEELSFLQEMGVPMAQIQGDTNLYVFSNEAVQGWQTLSLCHYTLPVELNAKELRHLDCTDGEMIVYGYQPMMLSAQCLHKNTEGCDKTERIFYLKDRYGKQFPVKNHCEDCFNIIYNISPLSLLHQFSEIQSLRPRSVRLSFTIENEMETEGIFAYYRQAREGKLVKENYLNDFTNGHFKRGVD